MRRNAALVPTNLIEIEEISAITESSTASRSESCCRCVGQSARRSSQHRSIKFRNNNHREVTRCRMGCRIRFTLFVLNPLPDPSRWCRLGCYWWCRYKNAQQVKNVTVFLPLLVFGPWSVDGEARLLFVGIQITKLQLLHLRFLFTSLRIIFR